MENPTESLIRDVLTRALSAHPGEPSKAVTEVMRWLSKYPVEFTIFAIPLARRAIENLAIKLELRVG